MAARYKLNSDRKRLLVTVYAKPAPQGSKSFKGLARNGQAILVESSKNLKPWRQAVSYAAIEAMGGAGLGVSGPIKLTVHFTMRKAKSAKKNAVPAIAPDLSKLIRSTEDALVDVGAIEDDARIIESHAYKGYPKECHPVFLPVPGAVIEIVALDYGKTLAEVFAEEGKRMKKA